MIAGQKVRPTSEAIQERAFGTLNYNRTIFNPGTGVVVSTIAPMPGCVIVKFYSGERMVNTYWLEAAS